jgi:predicted TIM-barrel fold metal-dependent hydrolase
VIIDSHSTIYPGGPLAEAMEQDKPGTRRIMGRATLDDVLRLAAEAHVDASVTWLIGTSPELARKANDYVAELARSHPGRFLPVACVDPRDPSTALAELERCIGTLGFVGLKIHPIVQACPIDDPRVVQLVRRAAEARIPVIFHVNPPPQEGQSPNASGPHPNSEPWRLRAVLEVYDSERLIAAHMGGIRDSEVVASRCSFQTTGAAVETLREGIAAVGTTRIMFGSDFPFYDIAAEIAKVEALGLAPRDHEAVMSGNALRLFGGPG